MVRELVRNFFRVFAKRKPSFLLANNPKNSSQVQDRKASDKKEIWIGLQDKKRIAACNVHANFQ